MAPAAAADGDDRYRPGDAQHRRAGAARHDHAARHRRRHRATDLVFVSAQPRLRPACARTAVGSLRPPAGGAGRAGAVGCRVAGGHRRLLNRRADRRAHHPGRRRVHRHRRRPRHHPRSVRPRSRRRHDRTGHHGDGDRADGGPAGRRSARQSFRLGSDFHVHHAVIRRGVYMGGAGVAGNAPCRRRAVAGGDGPRMARAARQRQILCLYRHRRARLGALFHLSRRRPACGHYLDGAQLGRIRTVVRAVVVRLYERQFHRVAAGATLRPRHLDHGRHRLRIRRRLRHRVAVQHAARWRAGHRVLAAVSHLLRQRPAAAELHRRCGQHPARSGRRRVRPDRLQPDGGRRGGDAGDLAAARRQRQCDADGLDDACGGPPRRRFVSRAGKKVVACVSLPGHGEG